MSPAAASALPPSSIAATTALRPSSMAATASFCAALMATSTALRARSNAAWMAFFMPLKNDLTFEPSQLKKPPSSLSFLAFSRCSRAVFSAFARSLPIDSLPSLTALVASVRAVLRAVPTDSPAVFVAASAA